MKKTRIEFIFENFIKRNLTFSELEEQIKENGGVYEYCNNQNPVKEYCYSFSDHEKDEETNLFLNEWMDISFISLENIDWI